MILRLETIFVEFLTSNSIGIFLGMITGTIINLFTADDGVNRFGWAILSFTTASIAFFLLLWLRSSIDKRLRLAGRADVRTEAEKLAWAATNFRPAWGHGFLAIAVLAFIFIGLGICITAKSNDKPNFADDLDRKLTAICSASR